MRRTLVEQLIKQDDENTYFLTAGVGYGVLEPLQKKMGKRFIDVGIAEPSMISIAAGLGLAGKKVYTFTMCCFYLRCIEQIRNDLCYQDIPVTMLGVGVDFEYEYHGVTHFATEDDKIIGSLKNMEVWTPKTKIELRNLIKIPADKPQYIRISRFDEDKSFDYTIDKYPKEGGTLDYFKKKYGNKKQEATGSKS